jgi:uncharacterized membrane protein YgcG
MRAFVDAALGGSLFGWCGMKKFCTRAQTAAKGAAELAVHSKAGRATRAPTQCPPGLVAPAFRPDDDLPAALSALRAAGWMCPDLLSTRALRCLADLRPAAAAVRVLHALPAKLAAHPSCTANALTTAMCAAEQTAAKKASVERAGVAERAEMPVRVTWQQSATTWPAAAPAAVPAPLRSDAKMLQAQAQTQQSAQAQMQYAVLVAAQQAAVQQGAMQQAAFQQAAMQQAQMQQAVMQQAAMQQAALQQAQMQQAAMQQAQMQQAAMQQAAMQQMQTRTNANKRKACHSSSFAATRARSSSIRIVCGVVKGARCAAAARHASAFLIAADDASGSATVVAPAFLRSGLAAANAAAHGAVAGSAAAAPGRSGTGHAGHVVRQRGMHSAAASVGELHHRRATASASASLVPRANTSCIRRNPAPPARQRLFIRGCSRMALSKQAPACAVCGRRNGRCDDRHQLPNRGTKCSPIAAAALAAAPKSICGSPGGSSSACGSIARCGGSGGSGGSGGNGGNCGGGGGSACAAGVYANADAS